MQYTVKNKTAVIRLDRGDEIMTSLLDFAKKENVKAAHFSAVRSFTAAIKSG